MALTIVQIAEKLLPQLLPTLTKEADILTPLLATELAKPANAALKADYDADPSGSKEADLLAAAKTRFGVVTDDHINTKIKAPINSKPHEYNLATGEVEITLNGLTNVTAVGAQPGVTIVSQTGDKLKIKIDPATYTDGTNLKFKGEYKGKSVDLDTVQFKAKDIAAPTGTLLADGSVVITYPADLTDAQVTALGAGTVSAAERVAGKPREVKISLKSGQTISADTQLPEIDLAVNGRTIKQKATISKFAGAAEESKGFLGWCGKHWKVLTGGLAAVIGLIATAKNASEDGMSWLGPILGIVGGVLAGWGFFGGKADATPAKTTP